MMFKAYNGSEPYIFISYAHRDSGDVYPAISALHAKGERLWYDEGIEAGEDWAEKIGKSIENCALFMWFVSPTSLKRDNVLREVRYARDLNKPILMIWMQPITMPDEFKDLGVGQSLHMYNSDKYGTYGEFAGETQKSTAKYGTTGNETYDFKDKKIKSEKKRKRNKQIAKISGISATVIAALALLFIFGFGNLPDVKGFESADAKSSIENAGFFYRESMIYSDTVEAGKVIGQSPKSGYAFRLIPVVCEISIGPNTGVVPVPLVEGDHVIDGVDKLINGDLSFSFTAKETPSLPKGQITYQNIPADTMVQRQTKIMLEVNAKDLDEILAMLGGRFEIRDGEIVLKTEDPTNSPDDTTSSPENTTSPGNTASTSAVVRTEAELVAALGDDVITEINIVKDVRLEPSNKELRLKAGKTLNITAGNTILIFDRGVFTVEKGATVIVNDGGSSDMSIFQAAGSGGKIINYGKIICTGDTIVLNITENHGEITTSYYMLDYNGTNSGTITIKTPVKSRMGIGLSIERTTFTNTGTIIFENETALVARDRGVFNNNGTIQYKGIAYIRRDIYRPKEGGGFETGSTINGVNGIAGLVSDKLKYQNGVWTDIGDKWSEETGWIHAG